MRDVLLILEFLVAMWPVVVVPAALMLLVRPAARLVFFLLGLVAMFTIPYLIGPSGPDSPGLLYPLFGLCVSAAAVLAEALVRLFRLVRRLRAGEPKG